MTSEGTEALSYHSTPPGAKMPSQYRHEIRDSSLEVFAHSYSGGAFSTHQKGQQQMTTSDVNKFRKVLEASVIELARSIRWRESIRIETRADELDRIHEANERDLAVQTLEAVSIQLREAQAALRRIEDGTYGLCMECEQAISAKRLDALSSASLCVHCQQDKDGRCGARNGRSSLPMAA